MPSITTVLEFGASTLPGGLPMVSPRRSYGGNQFQPSTEARLHAEIPGLIRRSWGEGALFVIPELIGPFGIADFVVVRPSGNALRDRVSTDIPPILNELDAAIVSSLNATRGKTVPELSTKLGVSNADVSRRIEQLRRRGAAHKTTSGRWVRHPYLVPVGRLHALECKVNDWRRALHQARTYGLWADTASVVVARLPKETGAPREAARQSRSGLAVMSDWLIRPAIRRHRRSRRLWASEHVVAALMD